MPAYRKNLHINKSNLWYFVGIITSDGNLSSDGRHIDITSKDYNFLKKLRKTLGLNIKIGVKDKGKVNQTYRIQFSNKNLYNFLLSIGLVPNKSLIQSPIKNIPSRYFPDFLRGIIDGDGSIRRWIHPTNKKEQWSLRISSSIEDFLQWLHNRIKDTIGVKGKIHQETRKNLKFLTSIYILKFGKMAARIILQKCYYNNVICLERKKKLAERCISSPAGWQKSKTIKKQYYIT